jgi:hypothetical protein
MFPNLCEVSRKRNPVLATDLIRQDLLSCPDEEGPQAAGCTGGIWTGALAIAASGNRSRAHVRSGFGGSCSARGYRMRDRQPKLERRASAELGLECKLAVVTLDD